MDREFKPGARTLTSGIVGTGSGTGYGVPGKRTLVEAEQYRIQGLKERPMARRARGSASSDRIWQVPASAR